MKYIKPKFHKKAVRKAGRQSFIEGICYGYLFAACVVFLFSDNS